MNNVVHLKSQSQNRVNILIDEYVNKRRNIDSFLTSEIKEPNVDEDEEIKNIHLCIDDLTRGIRTI